MYDISEVKKQIEILQEKICTIVDKNDMKFSNEIMKLSEELDNLINVWHQIYFNKLDDS